MDDETKSKKMTAAKRNKLLRDFEHLRQDVKRSGGWRRIKPNSPKRVSLEELMHELRIADAFDDYRLDPAKPEDWRRLAVYLAFVVYGRRGGAPVKWSLQASVKLLKAVQTLQGEHNFSERDALATLVKTDSGYAKFTPENLRYGLRRAKKALLEAAK